MWPLSVFCEFHEFIESHFIGNKTGLHQCRCTVCYPSLIPPDGRTKARAHFYWASKESLGQRSAMSRRRR